MVTGVRIAVDVLEMGTWTTKTVGPWVALIELTICVGHAHRAIFQRDR